MYPLASWNSMASDLISISKDIEFFFGKSPTIQHMVVLFIEFRTFVLDASHLVTVHHLFRKVFILQHLQLTPQSLILAQHFSESLFQHLVSIWSLSRILWWSTFPLWFLLWSSTRRRSAGWFRCWWFFACSGWRRCTSRSLLFCLSSLGVLYWWSRSFHRLRPSNTSDLWIRSILTTVYSAAFKAVILTICYSWGSIVKRKRVIWTHHLEC